MEAGSYWEGESAELERASGGEALQCQFLPGVLQVPAGSRLGVLL